jgi:hypothetical protein
MTEHRMSPSVVTHEINMSRRQKINDRPLPPRKLPTQCLCCGEADPWVVTKVDISAPFRSTTHDIRMEMHQCRSCNAVSTTPGQSDAISAKVRETHTQWMAAKFKKIQRQLGGMSLRDIEERTQISLATLGRISSAASLVEESIETFVFHQLEKLVQMHTNIELLTMESVQFIHLHREKAIMIADVMFREQFDDFFVADWQSPLPSRKETQHTVCRSQNDEYIPQIA